MSEQPQQHAHTSLYRRLRANTPPHSAVLLHKLLGAFVFSRPERRQLFENLSCKDFQKKKNFLQICLFGEFWWS